VELLAAAQLPKNVLAGNVVLQLKFVGRLAARWAKLVSMAHVVLLRISAVALAVPMAVTLLKCAV